MSVKDETLTISSEDQKDILELQEKIKKFRNGQIDEERFKLYRLTRGVYGQRQLGVQMFRIKIPFGSLTAEQLVRIADVSDKFATGNLHITTRQDIQLHYVKLDDSPAVWTALAEKSITAREACGNTVRNVTASAEAGIDPLEPFDVSPYAHATAHYFMRNPICQEMGRKIKPAFSSSIHDNALTFMHDFGFIPMVQDGVEGFKVVVGGGLGAQALFAQTAYEFLAGDQIIPFMEAALRIFDRYGEREKRHKARLKFLIKKIGVEEFKNLVDQERAAIKNKSFAVPALPDNVRPVTHFIPNVTEAKNAEKYNQWLKTNTFEQKQKGYQGVYIKVFLGDLSSDKARYLAKIVRKYAADDIRLTINQNILLKYVHTDHLVELFTILDGYGFAEPGYDSIADITACPGTDTCNLGVTNSTGLSGVLEAMLRDEYPELISDKHIKIKISGCMNACGQHMIGNIGFSGSSIKKGDRVIPAMQVVIGGGVDPTGKPYIADKVIKIPTKRIPDTVRAILDHYQQNANEGEYFNHYYERIGGKKLFYTLLKPLAETDNLSDADLMDWGQDHLYKQAIGVGECAGVILDMVGTIINDAKEKLTNAKESVSAGHFADGIYYAYATYVVAAKAILLSEDIACNTHKKIISDFQEQIVDTGKIKLPYNYEEKTLSINKQEPNLEFAKSLLVDAEEFLNLVVQYRTVSSGEDKQVVESYYKA
jgi:sulfite reductase (ferredoxin)